MTAFEYTQRRRGNPNMRKGAPSVNPAGRPAAGVQSFKDRLTYWLETKTVGQIQEIIGDPDKWSGLLTIDALVARRIYAACQDDGTGDFIAILDRLIGKPAIAGDLVVTHELGNRLDAAEKILAIEYIDSDYADLL